jgi:hypothetical protein
MATWRSHQVKAGLTAAHRECPLGAKAKACRRSTEGKVSLGGVNGSVDVQVLDEDVEANMEALAEGSESSIKSRGGKVHVTLVSTSSLELARRHQAQRPDVNPFLSALGRRRTWWWT